eukprot:15348263-Ditylum_brightwellii.AAC.1
MSSTLPPIEEEDYSDSEESLSDDGSEADELDNTFSGETNIASKEEDEQHGNDNGAVIVNKWVWEEIRDNIEIPDIQDHYNGSEGFEGWCGTQI